MVKKFFCVLFFLLTSCKTREFPNEATPKILNSRVKTQAEGKALESLFEIHAGTPRCGAIHIGEGKLLTASHYLLALFVNKKKIHIEVSNIRGQKIAFSKNYEVFLPEIVKTEKVVTADNMVFEIFQPDVAVIAFLGEEQQKIKRAPVAKIESSQLKIDQSALIAGFGSIEIDPKSILGDVKISSIDELFYNIDWQKDMQTASAESGDSGGPLFTVDHNSMRLFGIASKVKTVEMNREQEPIETISRYVRLDIPSTKVFLEKVLKNLPVRRFE